MMQLYVFLCLWEHFCFLAKFSAVCGQSVSSHLVLFFFSLSPPQVKPQSLSESVVCLGNGKGVFLANSFSMHGGAQRSGCSPLSSSLAWSCCRLFMSVAQFILLSRWTQNGCCQLATAINNFHSGAQKSVVGNALLFAWGGKLSLLDPNINIDAVEIDGEKRKREDQN